MEKVACPHRREAEQLLDTLYMSRHELGLQREFLGDDSIDRLYLVRYGRVWTYTQGIRLAQAARRSQKDIAREIAKTLFREAVDVKLGWRKKQFGGWPFSWNTTSDRFKDPRLVTGANAWAVYGIGEYILSPIFRERSPATQRRFKAFYFRALCGVLDHQRPDGLVTAGWTLSALRRSQGKSDYNQRLDDYGYRKQKNRVKASNVVTEHNVDMLGLLNFTLHHSSELGLDAHHERLIQSRDTLRNAIFEHLYDTQGSRFITGLVFGAAGEQKSSHTAVDNAAWLALALNLERLDAGQKEKLAAGLYYTFNHFVKNIQSLGKTYLGAHYFQDGFEDPYVRQSDLHERLYHIEATASMILALNRFSRSDPKHEYARIFAKGADDLWTSMQRFIADHGFSYASERIPNLMTQLQSATSAIWYIEVCDRYGR